MARTSRSKAARARVAAASTSFSPVSGQPGRRRGGPKASSRRASDTRGGRDASWASSEAPELAEEQGGEQAKVAGDTDDPGERDGQSDGTVAEVAEIEVVTTAGESVGADSITEVGVFERGADAEASEAAASSTPGARLGSETVFDAEAEEPADQDAVAPEMETLRDTVAIPVIKPPDADAMTEPDVESLARRDHLLGAVTAKLGRALKRALQDDQNELLNALRQTSRKPVLDELVPQGVQRDRFVAAASDQLARAYEAGAAFLVTGDAVEGPSVSAPPPDEKVALEAGSALAAELADDLSAMLRQRIEEALSELDGSLEGSADAAGIAYREWKGSRVEGLAGDFTTRAFAVGELAVLESVSNGGAPFVRWAVEDDDGEVRAPIATTTPLPVRCCLAPPSRQGTRTHRCIRAAGVFSCQFGRRLSIRCEFRRTYRLGRAR